MARGAARWPLSRNTLSPVDGRASWSAAAWTCTSTSRPTWSERRIDDVSLARRCEEVGLAGFILKSHYTSTAERAAVVRGVVPGIAVLGALVLNRAIGGMNPLAVEIAAREGARVVWMPTTDSQAEREHLADQPPGANLPVWAKVQAEFAGRGNGATPCRLSTRTAGSPPRRGWSST